MVNEERAKELVENFSPVKDGFYSNWGLNSSSTSNFLVVNSSEGIAKVGGQSCHGSLSGLGKEWRDLVISVLLRPEQYKTLSKERVIHFIKWLVIESPFADTFIIKDLEFLYKHNCVVSTGYSPSNLMAAGCCASRAIRESERYKRTTVQLDLIERGMNSNLALLISEWVCRDGSTFVVSCRGGQHNTLTPSRMGKEYAQRFLQNKPKKLKPHYKVNCDYFGWEVWGDANSTDFKVALLEVLSGLKEVQGEYKFPFKRVNKGSNTSLGYKDLLGNVKIVQDRMLSWCEVKL